MTQSDYVPADLDASTWAAVEPLFAGLEQREVADAAAYEAWLLDRSELEAACSESAARLYINMTCDTESPEKEAAYLSFVREVQPKLSPAGFRLDTRQNELAGKFPLGAERYAVLDRDTRAKVEIFREENIPLETQLTELGQRYQKIIGAMTVEFDGKERTLPQMAKYQESTDRSVRESAWKSVVDRRMMDAEQIDEIYTEQVGLRDRVAKNAGYSDFVGYAFAEKRRFDYTPEDCERFHEAVEAKVMPFVAETWKRRADDLGLTRLRPWDMAVDPKGREALSPFDGGADLVARTQRVFERMDGDGGDSLRAMFERLGDGANVRGIDGGLMDLDSRKGKAPGGYQYMQDRSRVPFIFMNAAGQHRDVETMIHEAGHAFHSLLSAHDPLMHYREAPIEFAEVASMSMELLTMPYWDAFYPDEGDLARARRKQIEGSVSMLPWIMTIDAFQMWVYRNPGHTPEQRREAWLELDTRFGFGSEHAVVGGEALVDWSGFEDARETTWQRQSHLFGVPFYYIEYGIAQLGALQLWVKSLEEGEDAALAAYKRAMTLGGSRPIPQLFETAGIEFDFGAETVGRLMERVKGELAKLPE